MSIENSYARESRPEPIPGLDVDEYQPSFQLFLISNKIPDIPNDPETRLFVHSALIGYNRKDIADAYQKCSWDAKLALEYLKRNCRRNMQ